MTREEKLRAVLANDAAQDGAFVYAVKTTGVYCRPSCASRRPSPDNVVFFDTAAQAESAGYRPCKRCRPDLAAFAPAGELAREMQAVIEAGFRDKKAMFAKLKALGVSPKHAAALFKAAYGVSPGAYADTLRIAQAREWLTETDMPVLDIALALGFESVSAFYALFGKAEDTSPAAFRKATQAAPAARLADARFTYDTAFGPMTVAADESAVTAVRFGAAPPDAALRKTPITDLAAAQLREYFGGSRQTFTVPLRPEGTPFQQAVWAALREIPYGRTRSYGEIAQAIGKPSAARAVGMANHRNPIAILIPCHRVVGKGGALIGYAAGLEIKQRLLLLEQRQED